MKHMLLIVVAILPLLSTNAYAQADDPHGWIGTETVKTRYGSFEFKNGYPTAEATDKLYEFRTFNRAVESYLHFVTLMSMFYMQKGLHDFGLDAANKFLIFETLLDSQSLYLTPNTESVYRMQFLDLKRDGPTVVEAPPGLLGGFSNMWQQSLLGVGPTGVDKGKGGKFLLLPPDYQGQPPAGYFTAKSPTYGVWFGVRGFLVNGMGDQAVALMKTAKIYPLAKATDPPTMIFLNGSGKPIDTIFPDNYEYFERLAAVVEKEPADAIPPSDRFLLASIGIEKGKPFAPDADTKQLLVEAARLGAAWREPTHSHLAIIPQRVSILIGAGSGHSSAAAQPGMRRATSTLTTAPHGTTPPPATPPLWSKRPSARARNTS